MIENKHDHQGRKIPSQNILTNQRILQQMKPAINNSEIPLDIGNIHNLQGVQLQANIIPQTEAKKVKFWHIHLLIINTIFVVSLPAVISQIQNSNISLNYVLSMGFGLIAYLFYVIFAMCSLKNYQNQLENVYSTRDIGQFYNHVRRTDGYFKFHAKRYRNVQDADVRSQAQKIEKLTPLSCVDKTNSLKPISTKKKIIFLYCKYSYQFTDELSQKICNQRFQLFKKKNQQKQYKYYSNEWTIPETQSNIVFCKGIEEDPREIYKVMFVLSVAFGFPWPFIMFLEEKISRYQIQFKKSVALRQQLLIKQQL